MFPLWSPMGPLHNGTLRHLVMKTSHFKVLWQLYFVLHCKLALKLRFLKMPICRTLEMQAFNDMRCHTELVSHVYRCTWFCGKDSSWNGKGCCGTQQQLEYFHLLHCRSAGIFTDVSSLWCHNILISKSCFLRFFLSTSTYQN